MRSHPFSPRRGFGRIDLLGVLFMTVVATGLLLPAIKRADEAAKKMQCQKNLRQIGIAAHNFHNDFSRLPSGYYGPIRTNGAADVAPDKAIDRGPWSGCLVALLPYLKQDALFKQLWNPARTFPAPPNDPSQGWTVGLGEERKAWWTQSENVAAQTGQVRLKDLQCPSDNWDEPASDGVLFTTHIMVGNKTFQTMLGPKELGRTNYTGVAGAAGDFEPASKSNQYGDPQADFRQWIGILYNRSTVTLGQVTVQDGTSNTLMFGESLGSSAVNTPGSRPGVTTTKRDRAWSWFGVGAMGTAYGLGGSTVPAPAEPPEYGTAPPTGKDGAAWYRFSSRHERVVYFCFGDVSVRGVKFGKTTEPNTSASGQPATPGNNPSDWPCCNNSPDERTGSTRTSAR